MPLDPQQFEKLDTYASQVGELALWPRAPKPPSFPPADIMSTEMDGPGCLFTAQGTEDLGTEACPGSRVTPFPSILWFGATLLTGSSGQPCLVLPLPIWTSLPAELCQAREGRERMGEDHECRWPKSL